MRSFAPPLTGAGWLGVEQRIAELAVQRHATRSETVARNLWVAM